MSESAMSTGSVGFLWSRQLYVASDLLAMDSQPN